jgi:hypothetical protein
VALELESLGEWNVRRVQLVCDLADEGADDGDLWGEGERVGALDEVVAVDIEVGVGIAGENRAWADAADQEAGRRRWSARGAKLNHSHRSYVLSRRLASVRAWSY